MPEISVVCRRSATYMYVCGTDSRALYDGSWNCTHLLLLSPLSLPAPHPMAPLEFIFTSVFIHTCPLSSPTPPYSKTLCDGSWNYTHFLLISPPPTPPPPPPPAPMAPLNLLSHPFSYSSVPYPTPPHPIPLSSLPNERSTWPSTWSVTVYVLDTDMDILVLF